MKRAEKRKEEYENLKKCIQFINKKAIECDIKDFDILVDISRHLNSIHLHLNK